MPASTRGVRSVASALRILEDGRHRAEFYRLWASGHGAGLTHPSILETMGPRESPPTEAVRRWLLNGTRRGVAILDLVKPDDAPFDDFERGLLAFGDESGHLDDALRLLGDFYTRKHRLMLHVRKALTYPLVTGLVACFVAPLPILVFGHAAAYLVTALGAAAWLLLGAGGVIAAVAARYGRRPAMARARMARALATGIHAGLPLPRALRLAAQASAHPGIRAHLGGVTERELATRPLSDSLAGCPDLTPEFTSVLVTAESTGDFTPLERLAELYEDGFR